MPLSDGLILRQNPWWAGSGWRAADPNLLLLEDQPMRLATDLVAELDLYSPGIHILRGPRQVGKSTDLKLLVERALAEGFDPRSIIYVALDQLEGRHLSELAASVEHAIDLAERDAPGLLLLDEVTSVQGWQTAVKSLWDQGLIQRDVVVCTGSSAIDLQRGAAERLPGRRQAGRDYLALPQSFASFAKALNPQIPSSPRLTIAELLAEDGQMLLRKMRVHAPAMKTALRRYMRFGGLPAAVAEAASGATEPSEQVKRVLYDSLVRELQRKGSSVVATHALLERVVRSLGSKISWSSMAREMDVPLGTSGALPSHQTVRDYIELLAGGYFLFVAYFWRSGSQTNAQSRDKKVFLADPLLHTIALDRAPGLRFNEQALIENLVGAALLRRYEQAERLIETFILPDRLHIWQTARGGEIDFVCGPRRELDVVEVKYSEHPSLSAASAAARAHPGRPTAMATKSTYQPGDLYTLVPAHTLLWALG